MKLPPLFLAFLCAAFSVSHAAPVPIFDGKTLEGWDYDPKIWRVEDGMITGGSTTEKITANYFICTKQNYANFELRMKIKCNGDPATGMINSGIQIRSLRVPGGAHMSGYQVDCGKGWFGKIYDEFRRNRVIAEPIDAAALDKAVDVFGWNEYRIRAEGPHIQTWINGVLAIDYTETDPKIALDGQLGPQVHSGGVCLVQVKDVTIEELPPTPGAPTWESLGGVEAARKLVAPPPKPAPQAATASAKKDISYNAVQGSAKTAAEQQKLFHLPDGYEVELVLQESDGFGKFVSVYFDQRGRLWTQTAFEYPVDGNENPAAAEALYQSKAKDKVLVFPRAALTAPLPPGGLTHPTIFADGLAIPLGILPWGAGDSCYIQHGHDLKLFKDTDGDGRADTSDVILTGMGVQDSHLFPHQFTRAPGGWIWMAQGLFNNSKVQKPGGEKPVDWPKCSMAKMRPDGSGFEVTSVGPNNIWGLVITGEGEAFIQEANDYGYPVMPFHEYAYYPGGMEALRKSYQPEFPPQAEFRMGGTGLSGLALGEGAFRKLTPTLKDDDLCMFVANPITSKVQTLAMHRDGPYWKLEQAADLITCDDPFFRPVALTNGPDGCLYIVDWYNKIISHNEVPRNHPDRDKTRGRIWRVKVKGAPQIEVPDFTRLRDDELIAKLGNESLTQAHLAWQTLWDQRDAGGEVTGPKLEAIIRDPKEPVARRSQALWAYQGIADSDIWIMAFPELARDPNPLIRRTLARMENTSDDYSAIEKAIELQPLIDDPDFEVRCDVIRALANSLQEDLSSDESLLEGVRRLASMAKAPLPAPVAPSSRGGKPIKVGAAYERDFERFLIRSALERVPRITAMLLDSEGAEVLPVENRLLAALALEPKESARRVAKVVENLTRPLGQEELLRLAQFPEEPGVGEALKRALTNPATNVPVLESLLAIRTRLDESKLMPFLAEAAAELFSGPAKDLGLKLVAAFKLPQAEPVLLDTAKAGGPDAIAALQALGEIRSVQSAFLTELAASSRDDSIRLATLLALAASRAPDTSERVFTLLPRLSVTERQKTLERLSATSTGGSAILAALEAGRVSRPDLDAGTFDRLRTVAESDPDRLEKFLAQFNDIFRTVLSLNGKEDAYSELQLDLPGAFTVETWVRLDPALAGRKAISNADGILGAPGQIDINFHQSKLRVWVGGPIHDAIVSPKPVTAGVWTHVAVTRDAYGFFKVYQDGELVADQSRQVSVAFKDVRIAWTGAKGGTAGSLADFRIWDCERTADEIRGHCDRSLLPYADPHLHLTSAGVDDWGWRKAGATLVKSTDFPPILTIDEAAALDAKYAKYRNLAMQPGDAGRGKHAAAVCTACHLFRGEGASIGPDLSGVGAMGPEAILRNLLQPNAAMEAGYRIYRVELKNGDLVDAFFVNENADAVVVRSPGAPDRRIARTEIRSAKYLRRSLMPEGLLDTMPPEQVSDLFAYLLSLK